ncbi:MAG: tRNA lysidine(34) synthetase TilS [Bacteroidales bacterium]|nr:tRNA lysidine(34) synthetase TilS [Bacteroidales bacterium]
MLQKFLRFISQNRLFDKDNDKILLAVSGGTDSVVMCDLSFHAGLKFAICHINFNLRGEDSVEDELFVRGLASKYGVEIFVKSFNTLQYAEKTKQSVEMAARELRYGEFERIMNTEGFDYTAVAHQKDDAVETFFLNLLRGSSIRGLTGIKMKNNRIIRPLLCFSRREILQYIEDNRLSFRLDKTNLETEFSRNKIRNEILPLFEEINPSFKDNAALSLKFLSGVKTIYEDVIAKKKSEILSDNIVKISDILDFIEPETLLFEITSEYGFNRVQCSEIFRTFSSDGSGKVFYSPSHKILKDRNTLIISEINEPLAIFTEIKEDDINRGIKVFDKGRLKFSVITKDDFSPVRDNKTVYFDLEKLVFPLEISPWHLGDFFVPFGGKFKKKLSDFFVDNKLSVNAKQNVRLLKSQGKIIWIIGMRASSLFKVGGSTKKILKIEVE